MKNFILLLKKKSWIIAIFIFILALILRIIAALKMAWRPDEIVYVDWIGGWFAKHFWAYFFQLKHQIYPPASPVFGNPPLAMWVMTAGIWIAEKFNFSTLIGARLVNCFIGSISALLLFRLGKNWFNLRTGFFAGFAFAVLPLVVTNNSSAYLETVLVLLIIIQIELLLSYFKTHKTKYLYYLGFILGLSILVKLTIFILALSIVVLIPIVSYKRLKEKKFWFPYVIFLLFMIGTPLLLWSGFRDVEHIKGMYLLYKSKTYTPYLLNYPFPILRYYYLMVLGVLAPIIVLGLFFKIIVFLKDLIKKGLESQYKLFLIVALLLIYLTYNGIVTNYGASHQLLPIIPLVLIIAALGLDQIIQYFPIRLMRNLIILGIMICLVLPLTAFSPAFWGLYSSILVGGTKNAFKLYPVGTEGETVPLIGQYLNENSPQDSRTAIMGYDWQLKKYLQDARSATPIFINEGEVAGFARAADFIVLPRIFSEGNIGLTAQELLKDEPVEIIRVKGIELARIYRADYSKVHLQKPLAIGSKKDWQIKMINNEPSFAIEDDVLKVDYSFTKAFKNTDLEDNRFLLTNNRKILINEEENKGLYLEILGDSNDKLCSIALTGEDNNYLSYDFSCDWQGWKRIYIPFEMFQFNLPNSKPNFNEKYVFSFGIVSRTPMRGEVMIRNAELAN